MRALPLPAAEPAPAFIDALTAELTAWLDNEVRERIDGGATPHKAIDRAIEQARRALVVTEEELLWRQREHFYRQSAGR